VAEPNAAAIGNGYTIADEPIDAAWMGTAGKPITSARQREELVIGGHHSDTPKTKRDETGLHAASASMRPKWWSTAIRYKTVGIEMLGVSFALLALAAA
jgi:hypothetical protein